MSCHFPSSIRPALRARRPSHGFARSTAKPASSIPIGVEALKLSLGSPRFRNWLSIVPARARVVPSHGHFATLSSRSSHALFGDGPRRHVDARVASLPIASCSISLTIAATSSNHAGFMARHRWPLIFCASPLGPWHCPLQSNPSHHAPRSAPAPQPPQRWSLATLHRVAARLYATGVPAPVLILMDRRQAASRPLPHAAFPCGSHRGHVSALPASTVECSRSPASHRVLAFDHSSQSAAALAEIVVPHFQRRRRRS